MLARSSNLMILLSACLVATVQAFLWQPSLTTRIVRIAQISRRHCHGDAVGSFHSSCPSQSLVSLKAQEREKQEPQEEEEEPLSSLNNIVNLVAALSLFASADTLWSQAAIYQTGCGPLFMPDLVERVCYQAVIVVSGVAWFIRIVFRQGLGDFFLSDRGLVMNCQDDNDEAKWSTSRTLLNVAEGVAYLAVVGAFFVLTNQMENNVQMDGLSGIDIAACKARRDFLLQQQ